MQAGDHIRVEVRGTNPVELKGYRNGLLILTASDTEAVRIDTAGPPGMAYRLTAGFTVTYPTPVYDSWSAGTML